MSLNGLDAPTLQQAFNTTCLEPGSWFLIHYISRDNVELLAKGSNGSAELRERIESEPDDSPLYGLIRYRRRSILLKYLPEAASRVLKARSQVHFQLVGEKFTPHDVTFVFSSPNQLTDSALTSVCSTHSASTSISSSNSSLRNRRLADIAESAEESSNIPTLSDSQIGINDPADGNDPPNGPAVLITSHDTSTSNLLVNTIESSSPSLHEIATAAENEDAILETSSLHSPGCSHSSLAANPYLDQPRRKSTSSARPAVIELYGVQFKIAPGPRPAADALKRPHTSSSHLKSFGDGVEEFRPIATIPKSVQLPIRKSHAGGKRKLSLESSQSLPLVTPALSIPSVSVPAPDASPEFPIDAVPPTPTSAVLSPEKQRLMKALQIRKNTMLKEKTEDEFCVNKTERGESDHTNSDDTQDKSVHLTKKESTKSPIPSSEDNEPQRNENKKVRGSDNEHDSDDGGSIISVEIAVAEPRPVSTILSRSSTTPTLVSTSPILTRSPKSAMFEKHQTHPSPIVMSKKPAKPNMQPEEPVIETARSVSAPLLNSARRERSSPAVPKTINVFSGSVSQRIKQLEMLNKQPPSQIQPPPRSPTFKAAPSIPPNFQHSFLRPSTAGSATVPFRLDIASTSQTPRPASPRPASPATLASPAIPEKSKSRRIMGMDENGNLKVATVIARTISTKDKKTQTEDPPPTITDALIPHINSEAEPQPFVDDSNQIDQKIDQSVDVSLAATPNKDAEIVSKANENQMKLDLDVVNLPPLPHSPVNSTLPSSSESPITAILHPTPVLDTENIPEQKETRQSRKEAKKDGKKELRNQSRSSSPKGEKKSPIFPLLKRMSSLSSKPKEVSVPEPKQLEQKICLLAGWVNVQLPDTMLWRRKCLKVDSAGWISLLVTDDETTPTTRNSKFHIPTEFASVKIPDPDEQELPFSVELRLREGGTLVFACQNTREQKEVLNVVKSQFP